MHVLGHFCAESDSQTGPTAEGDSQTGPTNEGDSQTGPTNEGDSQTGPGTEIGVESVRKAVAVADYSDDVFTILKNSLAG